MSFCLGFPELLPADGATNGCCFANSSHKKGKGLTRDLYSNCLGDILKKSGEKNHTSVARYSTKLNYEISILKILLLFAQFEKKTK